jgi:hypothetical protein
MNMLNRSSNQRSVKISNKGSNKNSALSSILGFALLAIAGLSQAQSNLPAHQNRLSQIQEKINLGFEPGMSFFEQVEAVQKLYDLAIASQYSSSFGPESLVRSVIIRRPYTREGSTAEIEFLSKLRNHLLYFTNDGKSGELFAANIQKEESALTTISSYEENLRRLLPNLVLERQPDYVTQIYSTNESYLDVLRVFHTSAVARNFEGGLERMEKIRFVDSSDHIGGTKIERIQHWGDKTKEDLVISIHRPWGYMQELDLYPDFLKHALNIVLSMGFRKIDSQLIEGEETAPALLALYQRLTPETIEKLKALNVDGFVFSSTARSQPSLIQQNQLFLGSKKEDIDSVIDFVTGN